MAYAFSGIFSDGDIQVLESLRQQRPGRARMLATPFRGFRLALIGEYEFCEPETPWSLGLLELSRHHAATTFVYLWVECGGGDCVYAGFVVRAGTVIHEEPRAQGDDLMSDYRPLRRLLSFLGVELNQTGHFEPLTRGFFADGQPFDKGQDKN